MPINLQWLQESQINKTPIWANQWVTPTQPPQQPSIDIDSLPLSM